MLKQIVGLIGYTGLVGSNILNQIKDMFEHIELYNSKNIDSIVNKKFDLLIIAGVSGNKSFANINAVKDAENIASLVSKLRQVEAKETVLISTIDVFNKDSLDYGINRRQLELTLRSCDNFGNLHILRLPGLFGSGLKKNVIYDIKHLIPTFIKSNIFVDLVIRDPNIKDWYAYNSDKDVYEVTMKDDTVEQHFIKLGFTSLNFSNINSDFYWFNLDNIWNEITNVINNDIPEITIISDVVSNNEIANICDIDMSLFKSDTEVHYKDVPVTGLTKTYCKDSILQEIKRFIDDIDN